MANLFLAHSLEQEVDALAAYLPNDKLFAAKALENTNLRKLLQGLGGELTTLDQTIANTQLGFNILETQDLDFIAAWEAAVGIPNTYFPNTSSLDIEERRQQILIQLRSLGVLTEQNFIDLAALLGYNITIQHAIDLIYPPYIPPFIPFGRAEQARFVMIVKGLGGTIDDYPPYIPPFYPKNPGSQLQTLFNILKPAPTIIIYL